MSASSAGEPHDSFVPLTKDGFKDLFETNYGQICGYLNKVLRGDRETAKEAAMDAFEALYKRLDTVHAETAQAYVWRIAINRACTIATRTTRGGILIDLSTRQGWLPGREAPDQERDEEKLELACIRDFVNALPYKQRVAIILHYYCDLSQKEIARILDSPEVTIRSSIHRARQALRSKLEGLGFDV